MSQAEIQNQIQRLYEISSLTDELTDDEAQKLLGWAEQQVPRIAEKSDDLRLDVRTLHKQMRRINRFVGRQGEMDEIEFQETLEKMALSAQELGYGVTIEQLQQGVQAQPDKTSLLEFLMSTLAGENETQAFSVMETTSSDDSASTTMETTEFNAAVSTQEAVQIQLQQLYEISSLTDGLTDQQATQLLQWGENQIKSIAMKGGDLRREARTVHKHMRRISRFLSKRTVMDEVEYQDTLEQLAKSGQDLGYDISFEDLQSGFQQYADIDAGLQFILEKSGNSPKASSETSSEAAQAQIKKMDEELERFDEEYWD